MVVVCPNPVLSTPCFDRPVGSELLLFVVCWLIGLLRGFALIVALNVVLVVALSVALRIVALSVALNVELIIAVTSSKPWGEKFQTLGRKVPNPGEKSSNTGELFSPSFGTFQWL